MATLLHGPMDPSSLAPPPQSGLPRAVGLALLAHALLIAALTWGVNWKSNDSPTVEAEIWSSVRQQAAPRAVEPPVAQPEPTPPPPPKPEPKVEPPPAPPKVAAPPPPPDTSVRDAQIALEREKKKREEAKERELAEQREQQRKAAEKKKQEQQAQAKREAEKAEKAQKAEKAERAERAAKAEKAERAEKAEKAEKAAAEAKRQQAIKAQQERDANARREEQIRRMQGMAGASGGATATGSALQSTGPSASYGAKVSARVRPNIVFPDNVQGNPSADVEVRSAPDGTITGRRLIKSSGNKAWDDAVLRAIDKTETLPRDTDGRVPSLLLISFRPKE